MATEQDRSLLAFVARRLRRVPTFSYRIGIVVVAGAALGVLVMLAILVNPLTSTLAGATVAALGAAMTGGVARGRRLPPELLFYAALALFPMFIALALIVAVT